MKPVRRVVTGHRDGKAVVLYDSAAPNQKLRQASGLVSTLVWVTDETPADISGSADRSVCEIGVPPPANGTIFRVVDFPPERGVRTRDAILAEMGVGDHGGARHPGMHRTRSIDYAIVLEGEIDMLLDEGEVHLNTGDVLVQQGTNHAWVNRGAAPCRIAFVLIDARAFPA
ncbi:MAG TPA: cupin domain-containing protein [Burkholderiales bacterium]|nr:cupin domain-containing protein [Burkholderiales bacterium]